MKDESQQQAYGKNQMAQPSAPPSQQDRSVSQPGKEIGNIFDLYINEEITKEEAIKRVKDLPQPSQPGEGKDWLNERMNLKASISSLENSIVIKNGYIMELKAELATLKSRPSEGWSDEDMRMAYINGKGSIGGNRHGVVSFNEREFKEWLSSYKLKVKT